MGEQYRHVGPALFELGMEATQAAFVRQMPQNVVYEPREVWLPINRTWVRADGSWISGWCGNEHFGFRPNCLNRWKLRRAVSRWNDRAKALPNPDAVGVGLNLDARTGEV